MRWKVLRVTSNTFEEIGERFDGTILEAMERLYPLTEPFKRVIAATVDGAAPCAPVDGWRMVAIQWDKRGGWTASVGRFPSALDAAGYELQSGSTLPLCVQVINRAGTVTQVILYAGTGQTALYDGKG